MRSSLYFIVLVLFVVCANCAFAANPRLINPVFQSLSTKNGLPQDVVNDIAIDSIGFVWIATDGGLVRWDGEQTKIINGPNDIFLNAAINKISLEGDKALWISTFTSGIYRLDFETQQITNEVAINYALHPDWVQNAESFYWRNEHEILITLPESVVLFNTRERRYSIVYSLDDNFIASRHFIRYAITVDDIVLMATTKGLYFSDLNSPDIEMQSVDYLNGIPPDKDNQNVKYLLIDTFNRLWVGTVKGLFVTDKSRFINQVNHIQPSHFDRVVANRNIWTMQQIDESSFWMGTNKGLFNLHLDEGKGWVNEHILEPHNGRTELSNKKIVAIKQDFMGNLWLSSVYGGALYFGVKSAEIYVIQNSSNNKEPPLSDGVVWSFAQTEPDSLWIGTENGLNQFNLNTAKSQKYLTSNSEFIDEGESLIEKLIPTSDGRMFVQTYEGIRLFDPHTGRLSMPPVKPPQTDAVFNAWNAGISLTHEGYLYFIGDAFYRYNLQQQRVEKLNLDEKVFDINFALGFLGESHYHNNQIFLAMGGGLWLIDPNTLEHTLVFRFSEKQRSNIRSITSWLIDDSGVLWLAFNGYGLFGIDADTFEPLYKLNDSNLLLSNIVYGLQKDDSGGIWFSSHAGLHRYEPASSQLQNFIYGRELSVSEFNEGASLQLLDGRIAYGSTSGVVIFSPEQLKNVGKRSSLISKQTAITEITVDNRELTLPLSNLNGHHINLNYDDNGLTIHFSALTMSGVGNVKYHYKLLRNNRVITQGVSQDQRLTLATLDPGDYQFSVGPTVGSFEYPVLPAEISINMPHAPWRSPYAYAGYSSVLIIILVIYFISRQRQILRLRRAQQEAVLFGDAFKQTRDWVIIFDRNKIPIAANPSFQAVFGIKPKESLEKQLNQRYLTYPNLDTELLGKLSSLDDGEFWKGESVIEGVDGKKYDVLIDISSVRGIDSKLDHYLIVISDISEQKKAERKLQKLANYDSLTGLVNRSLLIDRLEHAIGHARQNDLRVAVMFIDLDRFKGINDSLGHDYGDKLLRVLANRMRNLVSDSGTAARLGGDEFVIVIEDVESTDALTSFVAELIESVQTPIALANEVLRVSCSIGVAFYPDDGAAPVDLIKHADVAMYSAKKDTLNGFAYYTQEMNERAIRRLHMENLIKRAYSEQAFYNNYQPIVDAKRGVTIGVELLLRGEIDGAPIYPSDFISILEQLRYIIDVTQIAMRNAAIDLSRWYKQGFKGFVSINLSALHFKTELDIDFILDLLDEFDLPKSVFRFEITEGVLMDDNDDVLRQIQRLVEAGFVLALDDFGTGYSSLSYLKRFPLSVLKIDKSFVNDMAQGNADDALVSTTIALASSLNMHCVAEGVETKEQSIRLIEKGCIYHQGYYYAKPMSSQDILSHLLMQWHEYH